MKWTYIDGLDSFPPLLDDRLYLVKYEDDGISYTLAYYDIEYTDGYGPHMPLSGSFLDIDGEKELQNVIAWCNLEDVISHLDMQQENNTSPLETKVYFKI